MMKNNTTEAIKILGELMEKVMLEQKFSEKDFKDIEKFKSLMNTTVSDDTETTVLRCLSYLCIPTHLQGHEFLKYSITYLLESNEYLSKIYPLYYLTAKKYNTTATNVERTIRRAIIKCWELCPPERLSEVFGASLSHSSEKLCNFQFITAIAVYLKSHR